MTPESDATSDQTLNAIEAACVATASWLTQLPEWPRHPRNASGSVSSHYGPTLLSEHDCVMQFARHLNEAGVVWEDIHLEFSPGQWMFERATESELRPKRIDLAIVSRERLLSASFPIHIGGFRFDAVVEFALASNYWEFGAGSKQASPRRLPATSRRFRSTWSRALLSMASSSWLRRPTTGSRLLGMSRWTTRQA